MHEEVKMRGELSEMLLKPWLKNALICSFDAYFNETHVEQDWMQFCILEGSLFKFVMAHLQNTFKNMVLFYTHWASPQDHLSTTVSIAGKLYADIKKWNLGIISLKGRSGLLSLHGKLLKKEGRCF